MRRGRPFPVGKLKYAVPQRQQGLALRSRAHGLTQARAAQTLECSLSLYAKYERGDRALPLDRAIRLADLYQVTWDTPAGRTAK